jgi:hypothetical protein
MDASWAWGSLLPSPVVLLAIVCLLSAGLLYQVYLFALPKPIPGIPYNLHASKRLMGDIPDVRRSKHMRQWVWSQPRAHRAPLSQVFVLPFRRPTVIVTDYSAVVDILARRSREFDRGQRIREIVGLIAPEFHFTMETKEEGFKAHKELVRDLMTPRFLNEVGYLFVSCGGERDGKCALTDKCLSCSGFLSSNIRCFCCPRPPLA